MQIAPASGKCSPRFLPHVSFDFFATGLLNPDVLLVADAVAAQARMRQCPQRNHAVRKQWPGCSPGRAKGVQLAPIDGVAGALCIGALPRVSFASRSRQENDADRTVADPARIRQLDVVLMDT
ncbi:hypothetical protein ISP15_10670 [Dyella jejuensis]|uniref:Uncharacterized protein n=1 Tax=Dyella jejuensis TaxID=1432009 RepID=A0ABW8JI67_9GAMM